MNYDEIKEYWLSEEKMSFQGWDFSYIKNRKSNEPLPWDYGKIVHQYLKTSSILLDMGTGGGEYLLSLKHPYQNTFATESYLPNFELCKRTLSPLGINLRQVYDDSQLPFGNEMFDVVINRHSSFDVGEVFRLLKPNGLFITQQVGGLNNRELSRFLIGDFREIISSEFNLRSQVDLIKSKGFKVLKSDECINKMKFFDVGALVYFAKIIEWEFPDFSVDKCFDQLCQLHSLIEKQGYIETNEHRFVIVAQKFVPGN